MWLGRSRSAATCLRFWSSTRHMAGTVCCASLAFYSRNFRCTQNSIVNLKLTMMILKFCRRENFTWDFPGKLWSWAWFFWRPLLEGDFEICSTTPQLHDIFQLTRFSTRTKRYTVWVNIDTQLRHIQFLADLKHLKVIPSSLPSSRSICEGRGVVVFCLGVVS